ncbi:MAG TPA: hypothetical protein VH479_00040 [Acidimicrobiales bacterium]
MVVAGFFDYSESIGGPNTFGRCAITNVNGALHVCGTTADGTLQHSIVGANGFGDVGKATHNNPGDFGSVASAAIGDDLHVVATTGNGRLYHTIRFAADRHWQDFGDVKLVAPSAGVGGFGNVGCAAHGADLWVCGTTGDGWYTVRRSAGGWDTFKSLKQTAYTGDVGSISAVSLWERPDLGDGHVQVAFTGEDGVIYYNWIDPQTNDWTYAAGWPNTGTGITQQQGFGGVGTATFPGAGSGNPGSQDIAFVTSRGSGDFMQGSFDHAADPVLGLPGVWWHSVKSGGGGDVGAFGSAACTVVNGDMVMAGTTASGHIWLIRRRGDDDFGWP